MQKWREQRIYTHMERSTLLFLLIIIRVGAHGLRVEEEQSFVHSLLLSATLKCLLHEIRIYTHTRVRVWGQQHSRSRCRSRRATEQPFAALFWIKVKWSCAVKCATAACSKHTHTHKRRNCNRNAVAHTADIVYNDCCCNIFLFLHLQLALSFLRIVVVVVAIFAFTTF